MKRHKLATSTIVALVQIYLITYHYQQNYFVFISLLISALFLLWIFQFSTRMQCIFFIVGFFGFVAEALVVTSGAWIYDTQHLLGLPLWLPILWGSVGVATACLSDKLSRNYE